MDEKIVKHLQCHWLSYTTLEKEEKKRKEKGVKICLFLWIPFSLDEWYIHKKISTKLSTKWYGKQWLVGFTRVSLSSFSFHQFLSNTSFCGLILWNSLCGCIIFPYFVTRRPIKTHRRFYVTVIHNLKQTKAVKNIWSMSS